MSRLLIAASWMLMVLGLCSCSGESDSEVSDSGSSDTALTKNGGVTAEKLVKEMLKFYRELDSVKFTVDTKLTTHSGKHVTTVSKSRVFEFMKPNFFRVHILAQAPGDIETEHICDGKTLTSYAPSRNHFMVRPTPDRYESMLKEESIGSLLDVRGRIVLQLLTGNIEPTLEQGFNSARLVEYEEIDGIGAFHLSLPATEQNLGFDFWVRAGRDPILMQLQYKNVMTGFDREQIYTRTFVDRFQSWEFSNEFSPTHFVFVPPAGAKELDIEEVKEERYKRMMEFANQLEKRADSLNTKPQHSSGNPVIDFFRSVDRGVKSTTPQSSNPSPAKPDDDRNPFDNQ